MPGMPLLRGDRAYNASVRVRVRVRVRIRVRGPFCEEIEHIMPQMIVRRPNNILLAIRYKSIDLKNRDFLDYLYFFEFCGLYNPFP